MVALSIMDESMDTHGLVHFPVYATRCEEMSFFGLTEEQQTGKIEDELWFYICPRW